jgi:hypothetical protein
MRDTKAFRRAFRRTFRRAFRLAGLLGWVGLLGGLLVVEAGCESAHPEVIVVNKTNEHILLKDISFNGCSWAGVLAYDEATSPARCLPGKDRVHFQKLDTEAYCQEQTEDGTIEGVCPCDPDSIPDDTGIDSDLKNEEPNWFNYQTVSVKRVDYGDFQVFEITLDDMEQDFSVPGPYGH